MMYFSYQEGRVAPDNNIGRFISDTVASIPKISPAAFDRLVNDSLQVRLSCLLVLHLTFGPIIQGTGKTSARSLQNLPSVLLLVRNRFSLFCRNFSVTVFENKNMFRFRVLFHF